jgi:hypothetical protein
MMGVEAVLVPGSNDTLMLRILTSFSLHAIPELVTLLCGIGETVLCLNHKFQFIHVIYLKVK